MTGEEQQSISKKCMHMETSGMEKIINVVGKIRCVFQEMALVD